VLRALAARLVEVETMDAAEMDRIIEQAEMLLRVDSAPRAPSAAAGM
jgi:hypothetical protein